jgi:intein/homing endonuclease
MAHKKCLNCSLKIKNLCKGSKDDAFCEDWLPIQANCRRCLRLRRCIKKDEKVSSGYVCSKFRRNKYPPTTLQEIKRELENESLSGDEVEEDLFSPVNLVEDIISSNFNPKVFDDINEQDISIAKNDIDFVLNPNFMGIDLFPMQLKVVMDFMNTNCFVGETLSYTNKGVLYFNELYEENNKPKKLKPLSLIVSGLEGNFKISHFGRTKRTKRLIKIELQNGINLKGTPNQRIEVLDKDYNIVWKQLSKLKHNDHIVLKYGSNLWSKESYKFPEFTYTNKNSNNIGRPAFKCKYPTKMTKHLARLIGYLVSDGCLNKDKISFVSMDQDIIDNFIICFEKCFGKNIYVGIRTIYNEETGVTRKVLSISHPGILAFFYKNVFTTGPVLAYHKYIPKAIRCSLRSHNLEFLRGYLEGDGNYDKGGIRASSASRLLIREIQQILINLGVYSSIKEDYDKDNVKVVLPRSKYDYKNKRGHIWIWPTLYKYLKPLSERKVKMAGNVNLEVGERGGGSDSLIGKTFVGSKDFFNSATNKIPYSGGWYVIDRENKRLRLKIRSDINYFNCPYKILNDISKTFNEFKNPVNNIKKRITDIKNNIRFIPVVKITNYNKKVYDVFDYTIPKHEKFLANGISVHNCPYCSDVNYVQKLKVDTPIDDLLDRVVLYDNKGVCPKCGETKYDAFEDKQLNHWSQLIGAAGQRSGKSTLTAILCALITYKYLCLPNPPDFFPGVLKNTTLHGTFVSLTFGQAFDNLWQPYYELITGTKWFKEYISFLESKGEEIGKELIKVRDTFIVFHHKNLSFYPSGPDKRKLRGRTRIISTIDELGWFFGGEGAVKYNPDEIYEALDNSLMTILSGSKKVFPIYPYTPTAYGLYISSPSSKTDKSMRMYNQSKTSDSIYGFHKATWEFNPNISKDDLREKFRSDPVKADRDFGANPPHSSSPFISSPAAIASLITKRGNLLRLGKMKVINDSLGGKLLAPTVSILRSHNIPCVLGLDAGYSFDSFSCVLQHLNGSDKEKFAVSGVIELRPDPHPLSFPHIYKNVIAPIIRRFNVQLVVTDRWQSIDLTQKIFQEHNIESIMYTLRYDDFEEIRTKILSGEYLFPRVERPFNELLSVEKSINDLIDKSPVAHFILQLLMVKDTGRTVTKGDEITDDIFRAFSLGSTFLMDEDYKSIFEGISKETKTGYEIKDMCVVINKSSGGIGISPVGNSGSSLGAIATRGGM